MSPRKKGIEAVSSWIIPMKILCTDFNVPSLSYRLQVYETNAPILFLFATGFQASFFPKKYWYQNVGMDIVVQWGKCLLGCVSSSVLMCKKNVFAPIESSYNCIMYYGVCLYTMP